MDWIDYLLVAWEGRWRLVLLPTGAALTTLVVLTISPPVVPPAEMPGSAAAIARAKFERDGLIKILDSTSSDLTRTTYWDARQNLGRVEGELRDLTTPRPVKLPTPMSVRVLSAVVSALMVALCWIYLERAWRMGLQERSLDKRREALAAVRGDA